MAVLEILEFPDSRLRTVAKPVKNVDDRIRTLIDDMFETMYDAPGIGLAASQIDVHSSVCRMLQSQRTPRARATRRPGSKLAGLPAVLCRVNGTQWAARGRASKPKS